MTKFGIQKNIFYNILLAGLCLMYIAIFPNADWSVIVVLAMLGMGLLNFARPSRAIYLQQLCNGIGNTLLYR